MLFAGRFLLAIVAALLIVKLLPGLLLLPLLLALLFFGILGRRGPWRGYSYGHSPCGAREAPRDESPRANTGETTRL